MKGLILALILGTGSMAATNDNVQEFAKGQFRGVKNVTKRVERNKNISEEMQQLINFKIDLMQTYDFNNMTREEIIAARETIREEVAKKAEELGIEIPERRFFNKDNVRFDLTDEMKELAEYAKGLISEYDFKEMTEEEIDQARQDIRTKIEEKANELGVEYPFMFNRDDLDEFCDDNYGFRGHWRHNEFGIDTEIDTEDL